MKVECILEKLKEIVPQVDRVTGKNLALPVLSAILIVASGKTLKFRATNLDLGVEIELPAKIIKEGVVLVPGALLNSIISTLYGAKNILLETIHSNLHISTPSNNLLIKTYPEEDFPTIPIVSGSEFSFEVDKIIAALKDVAYSAALSDIKPEIAGVYVYEQGNEMIFVATDSFRLAEKRIRLKKNYSFTGVIIPIRNVFEIIKVFEGKEGEIKCIVSKNQISFSFENIYLTSRLIDGTFPDYKQIIPKENHTKVIILKQDIINSLKIASVFSGRFNEVRVVVAPNDKKIEIHTKHQEIGENSTRIDGTVAGDAIEVNFNHKYLFDSLHSIHDDSISWEFTTPNKPLVIKGIHDQSFLYLVMPMNR